MKGLIPDEKIEEIKQRADIVDLISEYVTLKKAGRNYLGLCPFHKEKTPSFTVSRDKQMFYCFGCGEGGHVFTFLMKISNMTFPEAARHLAKKKGVLIPEQTMDRRERREYGLREQIYRINEAAAAFFVDNLFSPAGLEAREYLKQRGIKDAAIKSFRLGYADRGWRTLRNFFVQKNVAVEMVSQAGLIASKTEGGLEESSYDRFRGRLIFPIEDAGGQVVAFGGRIVGNGEPKYLNSPETPVFSKGKNLYGLNKAKEGIRKQGYAILVEGYFDLISLWNAGMTNVLASMGTALTLEQVELMRRYTGHVAVLFDADKAGKRALQRSIPSFLTGGIQAKAVVLPENNDPDDYIRKYGPESLEQIIKSSPPLIDYYLDNLLSENATLEEKRDAAKEATLFAAGLNDAIDRDLFLKRISEKIGIDQQVLRREYNRNQCRSSKLPDIPPAKTFKIPDKVELSLILAMLQNSQSIAEAARHEVLRYFTNDELKNFGEVIIKTQDAAMSNPAAADFLDSLEQGPLKELLHKSLLEGQTDDETIWQRFTADAIEKIRERWRKRKSKNLREELGRAEKMDDQEKCNFLREQIQQTINSQKK